MRRQFVDGRAVPENFSLARPVDAADGHQGRGFARAVGADQGDDLAVVHAQGNVAQGLNVAVIGVHVAELKHRFLPDMP